MTLYTFHMCDEDGFSTCFEARELPYDSAAFPIAGQLLNEHPGAHHVDIWDDDRAVFSRYRNRPVLRPANDRHAC